MKKKHLKVNDPDLARLKKIMHRMEFDSQGEAFTYLLDCYEEYALECYEKLHPIYPLEYKPGLEIELHPKYHNDYKTALEIAKERGVLDQCRKDNSISSPLPQSGDEIAKELGPIADSEDKTSE